MKQRLALAVREVDLEHLPDLEYESNFSMACSVKRWRKRISRGRDGCES